jgi:serine/threonine protein kinase
MAKNKYGDWSLDSPPIGTGGQGTVYRATHSDGTVGALKRLTNPKRLERFKDEISSASELNHPNIVAIIDYAIDTEPYYAVYEYVDGNSLGEVPVRELLETPLPTRIGWCTDVATALQAVHDKDLVHRDVKPDNILIDKVSGTAKLCDFGLVYIEDDERVTLTEEQVGSRYYIPPECEDGRADQVTSSSDIYCLGKVLYYLLTGNIFARERHRDGKYDLKKVLENHHYEAISRLLDECITVSLDNRLDNASAFSDKLEQAMHIINRQLPIEGVPETYRCVFCCVGRYQEVCVSRNGHNEGYKEGMIGNEQMLFLECNNCGNCQRFKLKYGADRWFPETHNKMQAERDPTYGIQPRPGVFPTG